MVNCDWHSTDFLGVSHSELQSPLRRQAAEPDTITSGGKKCKALSVLLFGIFFYNSATRLLVKTLLIHPN